jgi:iron complex outermembrane receptor protein
MRKNLLNLLRLVPIALLLCAGVASAQSTGIITGVVTDASTGKGVPGAVVVATSPAVQGEKTAVTGADGAFTISGLPAGNYRLAAQLGTYKPAERSDLAVKADTTLRANLSVVPEAVEMAEVVVTGSRVRRMDLTAPAPVITVTNQQLVESGFVSVGDFLQQMPQVTASLSSNINNGNSSGSNYVDLRGLGPQRTLVLVNGRRMVAGGSGVNVSVDMNSIPFAAVDRIEILADGASSLYGSDAIAGVVNVITKKTYSGTSAQAQYGISTGGGAPTWDLNVNSGLTGDKGSVFFNAGYFWQEGLLGSQRSWATYPYSYDYNGNNSDTGNIGPYYLGSPTTPAGAFTLPRGTVVGGAGNTQFTNDLLAKFGGTAGTGPYTYDGSTAGPNVVCTTVNGKNSCFRPYTQADSFLFPPVNYMVTPLQRISLFTAGDYKISDWVRFFFQGLYTNRQSTQMVAPIPMSTASFGGVLSSQNYFNPTGLTLTSARKRFSELGGRMTVANMDTFQETIGLDGKLPWKGWIWDTSLNFGLFNATTTTSGYMIVPALSSGFGPSYKDAGTGQVLCGTPGNPIANCSPINLFGGPTGNTPASLANVTFTGPNIGFNQILDWPVNFSGPIATLWANRPVSLAFGNELYKVWGGFTPNPIAASGNATEGNSDPVHGDYLTNQTYAELNIPLVSDMPFLNDLEASISGRYSYFNTFGSNFSWTVGGRYRPVSEVALRGTYGTGYRAPSISELYSGNTQSAASATDPCANITSAACGAASMNGDNSTQLNENLGSNPNLKPETSSNWTVGVVLEPANWVKNLSLTVDYWSYKVENAIQIIGAQAILDNCYLGDGRYCNLITRNPAPDYTVRVIQDALNNVGMTETAGLDFVLKYAMPTEVGRFGFGFNLTWLNYYRVTMPDGTVRNYAGNYDSVSMGGADFASGVYPHVKFNANVNWSMKEFFANVQTRFIGGFIECGTPDAVGQPGSGGDSNGGYCSNNPQAAQYQRDVSAYNVWDLYFSYTLSSEFGKTLFGVGVNNIFNTKPPAIYGNTTAWVTDPVYDLTGTYFYFRLGHTI